MLRQAARESGEAPHDDGRHLGTEPLDDLLACQREGSRVDLQVSQWRERHDRQHVAVLEIVEPRLLAENLAPAQFRHLAPANGKLDPPVEDDRKPLIGITFANQADSCIRLLPDADAQHLPELHVLEFGEEGELSKRGKALRVGRHIAVVEDPVAHRGQVLCELGAVLVTRIEVLLQRTADHRVHLLRHIRVELGHGRWIGVDDLVDQLRRIGPTKWQASGQQVKQHHPERIKIGFLVERVSLDLLGAHVGRRTDAHDEGGVGLHPLADVQRQAEIGDLHVVLIIDQDVGRLDVAMDDALPVGVVQRHAAFENDADRAVDGQQMLERAVALERLAREVFHHHVSLVGLDRCIVDADDVRMFETTGDRLFRLEQLDEAPVPLRLVAYLVAEANVLERHRLRIIRTLGEIHDGRRATPDLAQDPIAADFLRQSVHAMQRADETRPHSGFDGSILARTLTHGHAACSCCSRSCHHA